MNSESHVTTHQHWASFGLRWVFLLVMLMITILLRQASGQGVFTLNLNTAAPYLAGIITNLLLIMFIFVPKGQLFLPVMMILGDSATAALFMASSQANPLYIMLVMSGLGASGFLHLGYLWGMGQAVGVLAASIAALVLNVYGTARISLMTTQLTMPFLGTALIVGGAGVWSYVLWHRLQAQREQIEKATQAESQALQDMRERTRAIYEMAATLSSTLNYEKILNAALNVGLLGLRERGGQRLVSMVLLFRAEDNALHVSASRGLTRVDETRVVAGREGVLAAALKSAEPAFGTNAVKDPELQYFVAFQGVKSVLSIPLRAGFDNYGVLVYGSEAPEAFTTEHVELLTAIGTQATIALQNAVLYRNILEEKERIIEVEENARKKLASDLHDGPTQNVSAIAMRMAYIYRLLERRPEEAPEEIKKVEELARQTVKEIRHMLFTMRPVILESQGLAAALKQLEEKVRETHRQNVAVRVGRDVENWLDRQQQGVVFQIIEEAVGNARKHAQAELVSVSIVKQDDTIFVKIADNGVGFDVGAVEAKYDQRGSLGMINLRERTELLEGTLRIDSAEGKGTTITVMIPLKAINVAAADRTSRRDEPATKLALAASERIEASSSR